MSENKPSSVTGAVPVDIHQYVPCPLDAIPLDTDLPFPVFMPVAGKMTCFRNTGDRLTKERRVPLLGKVEVVYIPITQWVPFMDSLERALDAPGLSVLEFSEKLHAAHFAYQRYLEETRSATKVLIAKMRTLAYRMAEFAQKNPSGIKVLLKRYQDPKLYYANHNVNVAIYSLAVGIKLKMTLSELKELTYACLVHNVGNITVEPGLLYKEGKLTDEERKLAEQHASQGAQLLEYLDSTTEVVSTARHHHERVDGKGYPDGLQSSDIHPFARICSIADVYDALISSRPYEQKKISSPLEAVERMRAMTGKFDPKILTMIGNA